MATPAVESAALGELTEAQREAAMRRFAVLRPHIEDGVPLMRAAAEAGVACRTAQRWAAAYRSQGLAGLVRARRSDAGRRHIPEELQHLIEGLALRRPAPYLTWVHRRAAEAAASVPAASRGFDGGKKINGRRRHVITDCLGLLLVVLVAAGNVTDRQAARVLLPQLRERFRKITLVWADGGYRGRLVTWVREELQLTLEIVKRSDDMSGFVVLPRRWVVERTLGWLMRSRRLVGNFETLPASSEAFIYFSQAMLMSRRLARRV
ncbi:transposase [Streptomyces sp. NPDC086554]|uniref:transposase n=1 Tax=Streptomyces sp. NPDC086554 TaxID=3154864 RepID=UPI00342D38F1